MIDGLANPERLAECLGYRFANSSLLAEALTHRSAGSGHNERLEFLGDAVLSLVVAAALFRHRPQAPEGDLSRLRASLVREATLAEIAAELNLGAFLRLGAGERRSGGCRRSSILADGLEALLGAVYLDAGFDAVEALILRLYEARLAALPEAGALKDPKTSLQEWLQARGRPLPDYQIVSESGEPHKRLFVARCALADAEAETEGQDSGRRRAEQIAAQQMLATLRND